MATVLMGSDLPCPPSVAVIGGGRWARVLLDVLDGLLPPEVALSSHSASNAAGMAQWAKKKGISRLRSGAGAPSAAAVLIANAASGHEAAALAALKTGAAVFLEKPLAPDAAGAQRILAAGGRLAASQVFRFARYADRFGKAVAGAGRLESLSVLWTDPLVETRYGEPVRHDVKVSFAADVLPHLCALVEAATGRPPDALRAASGDASSCELELGAGAVPVMAKLVRESDARRRVLTARAGGKTLTLDFSTEPGTIAVDGTVEDGDPLWGRAPRPVASMLSAYLTWAAGGPKDPRLEPGTGLLACRLADDAARRLG